MVNKAFSISINKDFFAQIDRYLKKVDDLSEPLNAIAMDWFETNKQIFEMRTRGRWARLSDKYRMIKLKELGFDYPLFYGKTGRLADAITNPRSSDAYYKVTKKTIDVGVNLSDGFMYPAYLHHGSRRTNLPKRPYIVIGDEGYLPASISKRTIKWLKMIDTYLDKTGKGK